MLDERHLLNEAARRQPGPEAGAALAEWLPQVGWRQWTVSLPMRLRWAAVKTRGFLPLVAQELGKAVWWWHQVTACRLGEKERLSGGAVSVLQLFGARLQSTPHFHAVMPEALWRADGTCVELPARTEPMSNPCSGDSGCV